MTVHLPRLPFKLDPLIKEAKRRMRRRRLLLAAALAGLAALAVGLTFGLQSGGPPKSRGSGAGFAQSALPKDRLIVLDRSIGPVRLWETRKSLERALGPGVERPRGDRAVAYYFGGRLRVTYGDHGTLRPNVMSIRTSWAGFHTASGLKVGASATNLSRDRHLRCFTKFRYCMSAFAAHQLFDLHHAEPSPQTNVSFQHGVITGFGIQ